MENEFRNASFPAANQLIRIDITPGGETLGLSHAHNAFDLRLDRVGASY